MYNDPKKGRRYWNKNLFIIAIKQSDSIIGTEHNKCSCVILMNLNIFGGRGQENSGIRFLQILACMRIVSRARLSIKCSITPKMHIKQHAHIFGVNFVAIL